MPGRYLSITCVFKQNFSQCPISPPGTLMSCKTCKIFINFCWSACFGPQVCICNTNVLVTGARNFCWCADGVLLPRVCCTYAWCMVYLCLVYAVLMLGLCCTYALCMVCLCPSGELYLTRLLVLCCSGNTWGGGFLFTCGFLRREFNWRSLRWQPSSQSSHMEQSPAA